MKPHGVETVAQRAVRGYLAGYIYGTRTIEDANLLYATPKPSQAGVYANVRVFIPKASVEEMRKREKQAERVKKKETPRVNK